MFYFYLIVSLSSAFLLLVRLNIPVLAIYTYRYGYSKAGIGHLPLHIFRTIDAYIIMCATDFYPLVICLLDWVLEYGAVPAVHFLRGHS